MAEQLKIEVATLIENEIQKNNHTLLESMKSLLDRSVQQLKRSSTENAENQLKEIKRLKYSEPHRFKKKANEDIINFRKLHARLL
jgi:predicted RecB family endonuclease